MNGRRSNRTPLYSHSSSRAGAPVPTPQPSPEAAAPPRTAAPPPGTQAPAAVRRRGRALPAWGWAVAGAALVAVPLLLREAARPEPVVITQKHIDAAVRQALQTQPLPSQAAQAYEKVRESVVRVVGLQDDGPPASEGKLKPAGKALKPPSGEEGHGEIGVGSGVVIVDSGVILTNLHVVSGARRVKVTFADGLESDATIVNVMPENDLAVLRAERIPDDLKAATLRSTADLKPGERVVAVGFPFGIGPSVSAGVVSGLKREFRAPEGGGQSLTNLIQFDAMANPGSSGGPLVTDDGEVVGIVTAILNPVQQRFFVGIGFAVPIENAAGGAGLPPF